MWRPRQGKNVLHDPSTDDQRLRAAPAAVRALSDHDTDREPDRQPGAQSLDALSHHVRTLSRRRPDLRERIDRRRNPRRLVPTADARVGQHQREPVAALNDRQSVLPDRTPFVPGPAEQPLPGDRAEGPTTLRALWPDLRQRPDVKQVGSAWKKVFRLSPPNDVLRKATAAVKPASLNQLIFGRRPRSTPPRRSPRTEGQRFRLGKPSVRPEVRPSMGSGVDARVPAGQDQRR